MKRVLLIITFGLLSTTGHCSESEAAPADQNTALATLREAGQRTNPFNDRPGGLPRNRFERTQSDPGTPTSGALKKSKSNRDLTKLDNPLLQQQTPTTNADDDNRDVFTPDPNDPLWIGVPNGQRETVSPKYTMPPLEITSCLGELLTARKTIADHNARTRIIPAAALPLLAWAGSKTNWAKELFPALFPRSGTSTVIAFSLAGLVLGAAAWAFKDSIAAGIHTKAAFKQMELSQRELAEMAHKIEQLRTSNLEVKNRQADMERLLQETRKNAANARQGLEGLQTSVQALVAQIKGDLGNAVHVREVEDLKERVTALEAVLAQISLNQMSQTDAEVPNLDAMVLQAQELAQGAQRFARTDDKKANEAFADAAVTEAKKKKKRFGLW